MKYCDSKILERNWFNWLLADSVPELERFRKGGLLYTKILGVVRPIEDGPEFPDPACPRRYHCIATKRRVFVESFQGKLYTPVSFTGSKAVRSSLPTKLVPDGTSIEYLSSQGYFAEPPGDESWEMILKDIWRICQGIVSKFCIQNEDHRSDLISEAFVQVTNKIKTRRLVYIPGKAPVFNLLTTTIHRILFSILNRDTRLRHHDANLRQYLIAQTLRGKSRSSTLSQRQAELLELAPTSGR